MGWQRGQDDDRGADPGPARDPRDPRLAGFAKGGEWDVCPPSAELAAALEDASGPEWRCPGASHDELLGLLQRAQALESWAVAAKFGILRALIREDDQPLPGCFRYPHMDREQASWKTCSLLSMTVAGAA